MQNLVTSFARTNVSKRIYLSQEAAGPTVWVDEDGNYYEADRTQSYDDQGGYFYDESYQGDGQHYDQGYYDDGQGSYGYYDEQSGYEYTYDHATFG